MAAARRGSLLAAVRKTVKQLRAEGRLTDEHEALVRLTEELAAVIDASRSPDAEPVAAGVWREFRQAESDLRRVGGDGSDDDTDEFVLKISRPTPGTRSSPVGDGS